MMRSPVRQIAVLMLLALALFAGCTTQQATRSEAPRGVNLDAVQAGPYDTGKMWTFDFPPMDYFAKTYNFNPSKEWFEQARLAALRLPNCSASFVSEDGLVMTNHHCARGPLDLVTREGEKLASDGFYAATLDEERKVPRLHIDQLIMIEDVTADVQKAFDSGKTDAEKVANRMAKIKEIQDNAAMKFKETSKDSMVFSVVTFYNGGRYSLYGYKRYTDIRIVYAPETDIAFYGGDPDNFTYPRYDFDCSFFRVYDDGKPLKTKNFFRFSPNGAQDGEAVFVIGNPGSTSRLLTFSQLEFMRDYAYPTTLTMLNDLVKVYSGYVEKHPDTKLKYQTQIFGLANSQKAIGGYLGGLQDPVLMAKKADFEKKFRAAVVGNPTLLAKYGDPWKDIATYQAERTPYFAKVNAYTFRGYGRSQALSMASEAVEMAYTLKGPEAKIPPTMRGSMLDSTKARMFPRTFVPEIDEQLLALQLKGMEKAFEGKNAAFNALLNGRTPAQAAADIFRTGVTTSRDRLEKLLAGPPDDILHSTDPLITFIVATRDEASSIRGKLAEIGEKLADRVQVLGKAMYEVYGTKIPPDATFTLRIADGVVKGYDYNGTIAPPVTTFYGLYDRYYSFGKKEPWNLPARWVNPPASFNLSTPMDFVSTCDIIGGNSGSPVINKDLQVVGLIFDGNIESLPGNVIFDEVKNRAVAVHSAGLLEGLDQIYKADRLVKELRDGKIAQ